MGTSTKREVYISYESELLSGTFGRPETSTRSNICFHSPCQVYQGLSTHGDFNLMYSDISAERELQLDCVVSQNIELGVYQGLSKEQGLQHYCILCKEKTKTKFIRDFQRNGDFNYFQASKWATHKSLSGTFGGMGTST